MIVLPAREHAASASEQQGYVRNMLLMSSLSDPMPPRFPGLASTDLLPNPASERPVVSSQLNTIPSGELDSPPVGAENFPELPNDVIIDILAKLDGRNRHAVSGSCKRLRDLAGATFTHVTIPVPSRLSGTGAAAPPDPDEAAFVASAAGHMATMQAVTLLLPPTEVASGATALERFLSLCLPACPRGVLRAETLCMQAHETNANPGSAPFQGISYAVLSRIAAAAPQLQHLSLPMLSSSAAAALLQFSSNLTTLDITVDDSPTLDHALQLKSLRHLSISTRKGLLYLMLSQRQTADLACMSSLQTLSLNNALLSDCRASWEPLSALTALQELSVSSPLAAERLAPLPPSLRKLQLPFFSGSLDALGLLPLDPPPGLGYGSGQLAELRCRQAFTEQDLIALSHLTGLKSLQCDNVVIMDGTVAATQAALGRQTGNGAAALTSLPVLRSVVKLQLNGYHSMNGLLGIMFPNLETLQVASVTVPRPAPAHIAPLSHLHTLSWPSSRLLPELVAACPELQCLEVTGINCQQRLEELFFLHAPPTGAVRATAPGRAGARLALHPDRFWWPMHLTHLTLVFSSCLRFRPKHVAAVLLVIPEPVRERLQSLSLQDQAQTSQGPGRVVDDAVLSAALSTLRQLHCLQLADCGAISSEGLRDAMGLAAPKLCDVKVLNCPRISRHQAERIPWQLGRPWLEITWRKGGAAD